MSARIALALAIALGAAAIACTSAPDARVPPGGAAIHGIVRAKPKRGADDVKGEYRAGGPERIDYRNLQGIVVWLEGGDAGQPSTPTPNVVATTLSAERFEPDVVALAPGDVLDVKNAGGASATLFAEGALDETAIAPGASARVRIARAGPALVVVEESDAPRLHVLVAPTRAVKVLASGDDFSFELQKPGDYVVHAWHWRLPSAAENVRAATGKVADVELTLSVNTLGARK